MKGQSKQEVLRQNIVIIWKPYNLDDLHIFNGHNSLTVLTTIVKIDLDLYFKANNIHIKLLHRNHSFHMDGQNTDYMLPRNYCGKHNNKIVFDNYKF
jgi:hypothetical protein